MTAGFGPVRLAPRRPPLTNCPVPPVHDRMTSSHQPSALVRRTGAYILARLQLHTHSAPSVPRNGANPRTSGERSSATPPTPPTARQRLLKSWPRWAIFALLLGLNYVLISLVMPRQPQRIEVSYTFFKQQVEADNVVQISTRADTIQGTFKQAVPYPPGGASPAKAPTSLRSCRRSQIPPALKPCSTDTGWPSTRSPSTSLKTRC